MTVNAIQFRIMPCRFAHATFYQTITVGDLSSVVYPQMLPPLGSQYSFRQGKSWICNIYFTKSHLTEHLIGLNMILLYFLGSWYSVCTNTSLDSHIRNWYFIFSWANSADKAANSCPHVSLSLLFL